METDKWLLLLQDYLIGWGSTETVAALASHAIGVVLVVTLAILANWIAKAILLRVIGRIVHHTPWKWDDALLEHGVFTRLSHLAPALVIKFFGSAVFGAYANIVAGAVQVYVLIILWMILSALLNGLQSIFEARDEGANVPVKGFAQAVKLVLFLIVGILVMSVVFGRSPVYFLSGLGAATAVMMLIFRDALLGLVAGVMISVNRMVRVGDWIDMPSSGADGDVIDVSLTTVKVRNWDRTITTIPSYDLISKSFKNYHGMYESRGRRIKRSINIDMQTIRFVDEELLSHFKKIRRLRPYLESKVEEIEKANSETGLELDVLCNGRRLTNIGTFRAYCTAFLKDHPKLNHNLMLQVRQLAPTEHGIPIEIYAFTSDTGWIAHENVQGDIFDHLLSVINEFGLRVFQEPSGYDLKEAFKKTKSEN